MPTAFKHKCAECLPHLLDRCRVSIIVRSGRGKSLFLKACVRGGGRFVRGVQRHHIALRNNAVYSPVLFKTRPTRRFAISPRRAQSGRPYAPAVAAAHGGRQRDPPAGALTVSHSDNTLTGLLGLGKRRIYHIFNNVANAGPGPRECGRGLFLGW